MRISLCKWNAAFDGHLLFDIMFQARALPQTSRGSPKKESPWLKAQVDTVLAALSTLPFDFPGDEVYGSIRAELELAATPIGGNDLLIAAHAMALDLTVVTDNTNEFS